MQSLTFGFRQVLAASDISFQMVVPILFFRTIAVDGGSVGGGGGTCASDFIYRRLLHRKK